MQLGFWVECGEAGCQRLWVRAHVPVSGIAHILRGRCPDAGRAVDGACRSASVELLRARPRRHGADNLPASREGLCLWGKLLLGNMRALSSAAACPGAWICDCSIEVAASESASGLPALDHPRTRSSNSPKSRPVRPSGPTASPPFCRNGRVSAKQLSIRRAC